VWVTISTEFVLPTYNAISYHDVYFTPEGVGHPELADLAWQIDPLMLDEEYPELIPNVTGGYVIGAFEVLNEASGELSKGK
jgi:hypothetical protein